jgi:hypothetical protein
VYCPNCESEYREGFSECTSCRVSLIAHLPEARHRRDSVRSAVPPGAAGPLLVNYCGFLDLGDARHAREQLRREGVRSEIVIQEASGDGSSTPAEEFWLRVAPSDFPRAKGVLGYDEADGIHGEEGAGDLACSACGRVVREEDTFCPHCGERFS